MDRAEAHVACRGGAPARRTSVDACSSFDLFLHHLSLACGGDEAATRSDRSAGLWASVPSCPCGAVIDSVAVIYSLTRIFIYDDIWTMHPETFAALGEPNRFRIVELLRTGPRPVNDIRGRLGLRQSQVSQHLKILKDAGLVEVEPRAQQRLYRLRAQPLKQLHKWLDRYRRIWEERFEQLDELVEELKRMEKSDAAGKKR
jgi:DNA-binding transcriptional ArsR family regulator